MKRTITPAYVFAPVAETLDLSMVAGFSIRRLFGVINATQGVCLYLAGVPGFGASDANGVLTFVGVSTSAMAASDDLVIIYDDGIEPAADSSVQQVVTALAGLLNIGLGGQALSPTNRLPVEIDADTVTLSLPPGLATATAQASALAVLDAIAGAVEAGATASGQASAIAGLQAIVAALSPLATATGQASTVAALQAVETTLGTISTSAGQASLLAELQAVLAAFAPPATAAGQASALTALQGIEAAAQAGSTAAGQASALTVLEAIQTALGPLATAAGQTSALTELTAIVESLAGTLKISATALPLPAGAATAANQPALNADGGALAHITNLPATQPVSAASLPLPAGAATETTLAAIKAALLSQSDIAESLWTDPTSGTFYMRRVVDTDGTIAIVWTDTSGNAASPTIANLKPVASDNALTITNTFYDVVQADAGTSIGDVLNRVIIINKAVTPPAVAGALWINSTTGLSISAPTVGRYVESTRDIAITAQSAGLALDGADVTGASMPAGGTGIRGWLSASYGRLVAIVTALGSPFQAGGNIGNTAFGISGTLPAFAAAPTVNLGALNGAALDASVVALGSSIGTDGSSPPMLPGGATGVRGWLRYIASLLSGGIAVTGTFWQATQPVSGSVTVSNLPATQPVSGAVAITGTASVSDGNNAAFSTAAPMTANQAIAAARSVGVVCTAVGNIVLTLSGGGTITLPVSPGWQTFPFAATSFAFANSATGSVYNLS